MSWITSDHFRPVFATSVGFVVTPSRTPQEAASRISSMSAVSRKIFTMNASPPPMATSGYERSRSLAGSPLRASKDQPVERERPRTALAAPAEDDGIRIAQPSPGRTENSPRLVEERRRRPQDLNLPLGPEPHARVPGGSESAPVLDERDRLRVDFARNEDRVGGPCRLAGLGMEHVGP